MHRPDAAAAAPARPARLGGRCSSLGGCAEEKKPPPEPALDPDARWLRRSAGLDRRRPDRRRSSAFQRSCERWAKQAPDKSRRRRRAASPGRCQDWRPACAAAARTAPHADAARSFFETSLIAVRGHRPRRARRPVHRLLRAAAARRRGRPTASYRYPLYRRPPDLVSVDLGQFDPELQGRRIARPGREGQARALRRPGGDRPGRAGRAASWSCSGSTTRSTAFFLEIQGSGQVRLPDGSMVRVGYADQNGRPYRAIGKDLIERAPCRASRCRCRRSATGSRPIRARRQP